ncbi:MAG: LytTR family DNA-binding domain-containing protein [Leadbetterella sp.]|nr:LytTR family DNA-binding domain-containing protein [Leadbetterella sp.]
MKITCIIVEDEPLARSLIQNHVEKVPYLDLKGSFADPVQAIAFLRENTVDLLFSDIQMPGITGISLLKIVPDLPLVIFTTAYSEYALEGYELDVVDYLIKPISFERFLKSVEKAAQRLSGSKPQPSPPAEDAGEDYIFVKDGTRYIRIDLSDIRYIEGPKDYVAIHIPGKKVVSLQTMKSLENLLPRHRFIRIHNSYIVALQAIDTLDKEKVQIGNIFLPVSDSYKKGLKELVERKQMGG